MIFWPISSKWVLDSHQNRNMAKPIRIRKAGGNISGHSHLFHCEITPILIKISIQNGLPTGKQSRSVGKNGHKKYTLPEAVLRQFTGCMSVKDIGVKSNRFVKRLCISAIVCYIADLAFVVIRVFAKLGDFLFENRWSTILCKNNPLVFGNELTFTR